MSRRAPGRTPSLLAVVAAVVCLSACAMTGGEEGGDGGSTPRNVDAAHMRNGDVLVGEVKLAGGSFEVRNDYLQSLAIEKRHLESLRVLGDGRVKVVTRHGDVLHGTLSGSTLTLRTKTGKDLDLALKDIDRVTFAE